ncbi:hypothetical protein DAPPUDRAFT_269946 [Daphnia pulex]|uniref:Uncharacterized protein n=1 Tax=Daphnia pulex TaxID=6669 RepID=E9I003_DAPPU|nr:hypothetical protein DAPPUDRAFT_269946 [Daphnia pulex]|eukprot:EFX62677.1 hypothetical protein DAPPUDRAFT_269946 [Daphnia pulex]
MSFSLEGHEKHYVKLACDGVEVGSIPSNVILQKERPVCMSIEVNCAVVGCCIVHSWVDHWCTDDSWVWRIPKHYTAALLHNIQHNQLLHQCLKYYITKEPKCYTTTNAAPAYYTEAP